MSKCRFYFSGYNLFNWSHLPKGMDPREAYVLLLVVS